ncbi:ribosome maturation protein RimP [Dermatophilus congolensis]|uniref:Ribosome maturation factor RimP n=2 Tax=Dermatophilus congolensis TaxID=1863 RepID=A0AA46BM28_9MICO|nr:ribosome maturation protein RimP [Dermatophilus congolensis]
MGCVMTDTDRIATLTELASRCAQPHGLTVEAVTLTPAGRRRVLAVVVDTDISGLKADDATSRVESVDMDAVAEVTRDFAAALDEVNVMGEMPYTLEVTSPGVGRRLERFDQFRRNVGRKLRVRFAAAGVEVPAGLSVDAAGVVEATGRLLSVTREALEIAPDPIRSSPGAKPKPVADVLVPLASITHANVEIDFASHEEDN